MEIEIFNETDEDISLYLKDLKEFLENVSKDENLDDKTMTLDGVRVLGDIYISLDKARSQAEEYGHSFKRELSFLAIHGFYHLLGYDHMTKEDEEIMFKKQEEALQKYGIKR